MPGREILKVYHQALIIVLASTGCAGFSRQLGKADFSPPNACAGRNNDRLLSSSRVPGLNAHAIRTTLHTNINEPLDDDIPAETSRGASAASSTSLQGSTS